MNIYQVKKYLANRIGKRATIKYNLGRNKYETYDVNIENIYDNVFTVSVLKKYGKEIKCFSYNDVIMRLIRIDFQE